MSIYCLKSTWRMLNRCPRNDCKNIAVSTLRSGMKENTDSYGIINTGINDAAYKFTIHASACFGGVFCIYRTVPHREKEDLCAVLHIPKTMESLFLQGDSRNRFQMKRYRLLYYIISCFLLCLGEFIN